MKGTLTAYILGFASCGAIWCWVSRDQIKSFFVAQWNKINAL